MFHMTGILRISLKMAVSHGAGAVAYNGPAIKGGCVTWRSHPATGPGTLDEKLSRWQDRYGVLFAVQVQVLLRAGAVTV
jgi:hypothetical protein